MDSCTTALTMIFNTIIATHLQSVFSTHTQKNTTRYKKHYIKSPSLAIFCLPDEKQYYFSRGENGVCLNSISAEVKQDWLWAKHLQYPSPHTHTHTLC